MGTFVCWCGAGLFALFVLSVGGMIIQDAKRQAREYTARHGKR